MEDNKLNKINNSGFKAPEEYFNNLEDQIMSHIKIDDVKTSGLKMPESYLNTIEENVLSKVKKEKTKVISLFSKKNLIYISGIAAALILYFSLGIFNSVDPYNENELGNELVENYIINEITDSDLAELLEDEDINHTEFIDYNLNEDILDLYLQSADIEELISE